MLEWDFGRTPKISNNLKTDEYFFVKIWTLYGEKPHVDGHYFSFSNIHITFIFSIFHTGFRFFGDTLYSSFLNIAKLSKVELVWTFCILLSESN